jgi:hypothetical protein
MTEATPWRDNSQAVQAHLSITQAVIQRMAGNSSSCKAWCITLVPAILVVVSDKGIPQYALIAVVPTFLFLALDTYYLMLERRFRNAYNEFIDRLQKGALAPSDLYAVEPSGSKWQALKRALASFLILPFYLTLLATIWIVKSVVIADA